MSTPYQGQSANITAPAAVSIASSTDATPIVITTPTPHGVLDGTEVDVTGHQVNVNANGVRRIGYISPTQLSLLGSVGTGAGAGGATGTVQSLSPPQYTLLDGSVPPVAGAFNTPTEFNADVAAVLWQASGLWKPVYVLEDGNTDDTNGLYATFTLVNNTWVQAGAPWSVFTGSGTTAPLHSGDLLLVEADINYSITEAGGAVLPAQFAAALFALLAEPGVAFAALTRIPCSMRLSNSSPVAGASTFTTAGSLHLAGALPITGHGQKFQITIQARTASSTAFSGGTVFFSGDWRVRATVLRPTGIPQ